MPLSPKTPLENKDYGVEWEDVLPTGVTIDSVTASITPSGMTSLADGILGTVTLSRLTGGTAGTSYVVTHRIVTSGGETLEAAFTVDVMNPEDAQGLTL